VQRVTEYHELLTSVEIDRTIREAIFYYIDPETCQACMIRGSRCPVEAIIGAKNQV